HAMPASGMASLIKTALSVYHGVLPPTLHCETPHPRLAQTRFRTLGAHEPWHTPREERVAALNAFGFGGINAHVVLRGLPQLPAQATAGLSPVLMLSADTPQQLLARFDAGERDATPQPGRSRLLVLSPDAKKLATARKAVASGKPWPGRQQIWFSPAGQLGEGGGKLAFVFPGVDSSFQPQAADLADYFGKPLPPHCEPQDPSLSLSRMVVGLLGFNRYLFDRLGELGIQADAYAGHSVGEWSAMLCAGMMDQALSDRTNAGLDFDAVKFPDLQFLAASCDEARLKAAMQGLERIAISHDNCPHQVIACGSRESIAVVAARLRESAIFANVLPFVSGFHSPLFAEHMDWYREFFGAAELAEPMVPVWSATSAAPFPVDMDAKRRLALDHLLQPVRFRELTENLYEQGFRVFVEVGTGSLTGFIDDTLSGRPHLALRANHEARGGMAQLQQLCAALWVEGAHFDTRLLVTAPPLPSAPAEAARSASSRRLALGVPLVRMAQPLEPHLLPTRLAATSDGTLPPAAANDPVGRLVRDTLADIERAGREVLAAWQQHRGQGAIAVASHPARPVLPGRVQRLLDIQRTIPYVRDHELYPQRPGWPIVADRHPVVPMTMEVMLVREAVEEALPAFKVVEVSRIQAYSWLAVSRQLNVDIALKWVADDRIETEIVGYFKAEVRVAAGYPPADLPAPAALQSPRDTAVTAAELYREGWMFHGPAYQGVAAFQGIGSNGIDGRLRVPEGKGALLDNMGQLAGYWVMEQPQDCLAMPIGVDSIRFFAPDPSPGEELQAQVRIVELDALNCVTDHQLRDAQGRLRIAIQGWRTRRYQMDKAFWVASRKLSQLQASQFVPPNVALFEDRYDTAILRDYISRRYLSASERAAYDALSPRRRRQWLAGRVAAKDAVRAWLQRERGTEAVWPQEFTVVNDEAGAPQLRANVTATLPQGLQVSLAHKGNLAVAIVGEQAVGIDLERIEPREPGFLEMAFSPGELALLAGADADAEYTRGWVAKEVAAKAAGTGLQGKPRDYVIEARDGDCLRVNGHWVVTHPLRDCIVGWSLPAAQAQQGAMAEAVQG
ncbi:MAG TPA: 4'-phosphopantetheinyl transferase superfamily protein, partial [Solimonas sp.]